MRMQNTADMSEVMQIESFLGVEVTKHV